MKNESKKSNLLVMVMKTHFVLLLVSCTVVLPISAYGDTPNISWVGPHQTSYRYSGGVMVGFVSAPHFINEGGPGTIEISGRIEKDGAEHSTFETKYFDVEAGRDYELFIEGDCGGACTVDPPFETCPYPVAFLDLIIDSPSAAYPLDLPVLSGPLYPWAYASITNIELRQGFSNYLLLSTDRLTIAEGATATFNVSLRLDPFGTFEVAVANESGDPDITVESGASLAFDSSNYSVPQSVTLRAAEDGDRFNGTASIAVTAPGVTTRRVTVTERDNEPYVNIVLVDADAPGANDGSSWADAYNYLQDALTAASSGYEIWVAQGIYKPDQGATVTPGYRTATFQLLEGVAVRGGYAGFGQPDPDARDIDKYQTILSGDLNGNDVEVNDPCDLVTEPTRAENSYHVVTASHTGASAVLDGFTIKAGNANGDMARSYNLGGGMHYYSASPTLTNCTFTVNSAYRGGGMYNGSSNSPTLTDCTFTGNAASYGGGMYNDASSDPTLTNCTFSGNSAKYYDGGGMYNATRSSPTLTNCTFSENAASDKGGGMYNDYDSSPTLTNCTFSGNSANYWGGGMGNYKSSQTLTNCIFSGNWADNWGGGVYNYKNSSQTVTNCAFSSNTATWGGGMGNYESSPTVTDCIFTDNRADNNGGGMNNSRGSPTLTNCTFSSNSASYGGGMLNFSSSPTLTNCTFSGNSATYGGGGMYDYDNSPIVIGCAFSGNLAGEDGGGMDNWESNPTVANCTFSENSAVYYGGGIDNEPNSNLMLVNCILWRNTATNGSQIALKDSSTLSISYCDVQGGPAAVYDPCGGLVWGAGNIDADPCFVDAGYWDPNGTPADANDDFWVNGDYHLLAGSPSIDAGDNMAVPPSVVVDLDGHPRFLDDVCTTDKGNGTPPIVDIGAYEFAYRYFGDLDGDCVLDVNFKDFAIFALAWLTEPTDAGWNPDCDISIPPDNSIDEPDLAVLVKYWLIGL